MKLILEQNQASFEVPKNQPLLIGNDENCQIQINRPEVWGVHAKINRTGYGLILQVESTPLEVNGINIHSQCMLYPGDVLTLSDLAMLLVDEDYIPKAVKQAASFDALSDTEDLSSVYGLRHLSGAHNGTFIKSNYHHPDGWHIYRNDSEMALITNKQPVFVNGKQVENIWLKNGDRIRYHELQFNVECPGHSGYSKFSPSHPRNVMLSEALDETEQAQAPRQSWRTHYWWITLLLGLLVLIMVILSIS